MALTTGVEGIGEPTDMLILDGVQRIKALLRQVTEKSEDWRQRQGNM